ncbi:MAG: prohead protease [Desulfobulbus propionicus]|nr:MAG: prohead protease [Desulfobulbus propionicus]
MDIITTHSNADFDALASMAAAKRLYPEALLVFNGSEKKRLRKFLTHQFGNIYEFRKAQHIKISEINRLILVDTREKSRIDRLAACLDNPHLELHIYDHHPVSSGDLQGQLEHIDVCGATTTIFARLFRQRGITPARNEATLMALGIYEKTGCFLRPSTTQADLEAASWLFGLGASLDVITQFISRELSTPQSGVLKDLTGQARTYLIRSVNVVVTKLVLPEYMDDVTVIVQRMMVQENLDVIFALVRMGERLHLIARSRIPEVNVGIIARAFGGGGHASAASATLASSDLHRAEEYLLDLLHQHIRPKAIAKELMSAPVICVTPKVSIQDAHDLLTRYGVTVLLVAQQNGDLERGRPPLGFSGIISRSVIERAIFHKLGALPVGDYMTTDIATLPPTASLAEIQELIIGHRQRIIPILQHDKILGVISRTDLLNLLVNDPATLPKNLLQEDEHPSVERSRNLLDVMVSVLPREIIALLRQIGESAEVAHCRAYVAGGFVRDLLLQVRNTDIDVVVEGDGIAFARTYAIEKNGSLHTHEKFGTATVVLPDGMRVDIATARLEYYDHPAAMPTVERSSIKLDLFRRDFTINAMAIHLNPDSFGLLVDFFSCRNDLKEGKIRCLHNLSFVEDPTRIFRAIRFEQRLNFRITHHTEKLINNAVRMNLFGRASEPRFFSELTYILSEKNPLPALQRMEEFKLFPLLWPDLHPSLRIDRRFLHTLTQAGRAISWFDQLYPGSPCEIWTVYLLVIMGRSQVRQLENLCARFDLPKKLSKKLVFRKTHADRIAVEMFTRPFMKPSEIYWLLGELDNEGLLYLMAIARKKYMYNAVKLFITTYRDIQPILDGTDLKDMGYQTGPSFRTMLNHLIEAQLNGKIADREDAKIFIGDNYPL